MSLSVASAQDFFFEVSDVSANGNFVFNNTAITNFQITVNRVNQSNGTNDFVSSKFLTADVGGKLPKTQVFKIKLEYNGYLTPLYKFIFNLGILLFGSPNERQSSKATGFAPIVNISRSMPPTPVAAPWNGSI